jgi:hypothetical protein
VLTTLNRSFVLKALTIGLAQIGIASPCDPLRFRQGGRQIVAMPLRTGDASSNPAPASTPQPEPAETAPQPPAQPKEKPMTETNGHHTNGAATPHLNGGNHSPTPVIPAAEKSAIEVAIEKLDAFKATFREALVGLTELTTLLKQSVREQKAGEKEIQQVRQTLRQLQNVKF